MKSPGTIYKKMVIVRRMKPICTNKKMRNGEKEEEKKNENLMAFESPVIVVFPGKVYLKKC